MSRKNHPDVAFRKRFYWRVGVFNKKEKTTVYADNWNIVQINITEDKTLVFEAVHTVSTETGEVHSIRNFIKDLFSLSEGIYKNSDNYRHGHIVIDYLDNELKKSLGTDLIKVYIDKMKLVPFSNLSKIALNYDNENIVERIEFSEFELIDPSILEEE